MLYDVTIMLCRHGKGLVSEGVFMDDVEVEEWSAI